MAVMKASMKTMKAMKVSKGSMKKLSRKADREFKDEVTLLREENAALRAEHQMERVSRLDILREAITLIREAAAS